MKTGKQVGISEAKFENTKEQVNHHGTASWGTHFKSKSPWNEEKKRGGKKAGSSLSLIILKD